MKPRVLVVDDDELLCWSLRERLEQEGFEVRTSGTGADALQQARDGVDLVVLDFELPDLSGVQVLRELAGPSMPQVIMLTAYSTVERAVEAMQLGAYHYARKPFDPDEVVLLIRKALEDGRLRRTVRRLLDRELAHAGLERLVGSSRAMADVKEMLVKIAASPATTVLITGESGTGKDVAARTIHALSERRDGPFMNITCSALPESLLESELFGHERGAFTDARTQKRGLLEEADGGTVFLDEVSEMGPPLQAKLLRFLEERAFRRIGGTRDLRPDVRVVAATNRNLEQAIAEGAFRQDLYYRLAVLHVRMPALRERGADVRLLTEHFAQSFSRDLRRPLRGITDAALDQLGRHAWPGNVRELKNTIERAVLLGEGDQLDVGDLVPLSPEATARHAYLLPAAGVDLNELELSLVRQALERTGGNKSRAARLLGLTRDQIRHRVVKFGLEEAGADDTSTEEMEALRR